MNTIAVKTSELIGPALDWAVAKCEGHELMLFDQLWRDNAARKGYPSLDVEWHLQRQPQKGQHVIVEMRYLQLDQRNPENLTPTRCAVDIPNYSTDWAQGGPIIERERTSIIEEPIGLWMGSIGGCTDLDMPLYQEHGPTPLIAAMRCYVASTLGDTMEIPKELMP